MHNVGVPQRCQALCLADKACREIRVGLQIHVKNLDGDVALLLSIEGLPGLDYFAWPYALKQFVFIQNLRTCTHGGLYNLYRRLWAAVRLQLISSRTVRHLMLLCSVPV